MRPLPRSHSIDFMNILRCSQKWLQIITRTAFETTSNVKLDKNQRQIWIRDIWSVYGSCGDCNLNMYGSRNKRNVTFIHDHENINITYSSLDMFVYMKFDADCNENTPAISSPRFHKDSNMRTQNEVKSVPKLLGRAWIVELEKNQWQIWNQRPLKRWRLLWLCMLRWFRC